METVKITENNFNEEVRDSSIPVVLDFWASWCGPCQMMAPVFEQMSSELAGRVKFGKVNTEEEILLARKFNISGIPTLSIVKNGREIDRITGFAPKEYLMPRILKSLER